MVLLRVFTLALVSLSFSVIAQNHFLQAEIVAGSSRLFSKYKPENYSIKRIPNLAGETNVIYYFENKKKLQLGLAAGGSYFSATEKSTITDSFVTKNAFYYHLMYVNFKVHVGYRFGEKWEINLEPFFGFRFFKKITSKGETTMVTSTTSWKYDLSELTMSHVDYGLQAALRYSINSRLIFTICYRQGFQNVSSMKSDYYNYDYPYHKFTQSLCAGISINLMQ